MPPHFRSLAYLFALLGFMAAHADDPPVAKAETPNVLMIVVDTLRADRLGCYGYERPTTPTIDTLASQGLRFSNTTAASSWTMPSLMTLFTGVYPGVHGIVQHREKRTLPDTYTTLAAELAAAGYYTEGISSNPLVSRTYGFDRGYTRFDDFSVEVRLGMDDMAGDHSHGTTNTRISGHIVADLAVAALRKSQKREQPFFLFTLLFDPHADYLPPEPYAKAFTDPDYDGREDGTKAYDADKRDLTDAEKQHLSNLYDAEIAYTDAQIKRLLAELDALELASDTIVILVADHGEEFWEHGEVVHGRNLHRETTQVPWIMRWPGRIEAASVVDTQVSHLDMMPTILSLLGRPVPRQCTGTDALGKTQQEATPASEGIAYLELALDERPMCRAAKTAKAKVIYFPDTERYAYYNLETDPHELTDLAETPEAAAFASLKRRLDRWHAALPPLAPAAEKAQDAELLEKLKSMGYAQ